ncbi:MAG: ATP synthase F1 subunit epsilon [Kiritimatiellaeota bacterium]|nr:ATP synthase F1 subunit epsilon [Kiritimatiellota bacterium]
MAPAYSIQMLTPEGEAYEGEATAVVAPGELGSFGVLAHHQPMIAALTAGVLKITTADAHNVAFDIGPGLLEVTPEHNVIILTDDAATHEDATAS